MTLCISTTFLSMEINDVVIGRTNSDFSRVELVNVKVSHFLIFNVAVERKIVDFCRKIVTFLTKFLTRHESDNVVGHFLKI